MIWGNTAISTFPILPNEEFRFNYNEKHGVELEFGLKKDKNKNKRKYNLVTMLQLFFFQMGTQEMYIDHFRLGQKEYDDFVTNLDFLTPDSFRFYHLFN
jgi:hypothetical protein